MNSKENNSDEDLSESFSVLFQKYNSNLAAIEPFIRKEMENISSNNSESGIVLVEGINSSSPFAPPPTPVPGPSSTQDQSLIVTFESESPDISSPDNIDEEALSKVMEWLAAATPGPLLINENEEKAVCQPRFSPISVESTDVAETPLASSIKEEGKERIQTKNVGSQLSTKPNNMIKFCPQRIRRRVVNKRKQLIKYRKLIFEVVEERQNIQRRYAKVMRLLKEHQLAVSSSSSSSAASSLSSTSSSDSEYQADH